MFRLISTFITVAMPLHCISAEESLEEKVTLDDHISAIVQLTHPDDHAQVNDFLSKTPKSATGLTVNATLAKNAINRIDFRKAYLVRASCFEVFSNIASNTARKPHDRAYAISMLRRVTAGDAELIPPYRHQCT